MVKELFVRNGRYINFPSNARKTKYGGNEQSTILGSVNAKGYADSSNKKQDSMKAKKKALVMGRKFEREGWKIVTIRGIYSYGNDNPYRYDIESWGGYNKS